MKFLEMCCPHICYIISSTSPTYTANVSGGFTVAKLVFQYLRGFFINDTVGWVI